MIQDDQYPVQFSVEYPDRSLNRLSTFFRLIVALPILFLFGTVSGGEAVQFGENAGQGSIAAGGGALFLGPLLMILFRQKYPRWWFDWNLNLSRFSNRVFVFLALMDDRYPSTDEDQSVRLDFPYPDAEKDLNRWLPLVKWLLAVPHYVVLLLLFVAGVVCVVIAWLVIVLTGRYPRPLFNFLEGAGRWANRVGAYAFLLVTDKYPPFRLKP